MWQWCKTRIRNLMWIREIFALEFGVSDVQHNYSRVYAWMANQLGHMTLGLGTALLMFWVKETVESGAALYAAYLGAPGADALVCVKGAFACTLNNWILLGTILALVLIFGVVFYFGLKPPPRGPDLRAGDQTAFAHESYPRLPDIYRVFAFCLVIGLSIIATVLLKQQLDAGPESAAETRAILDQIGTTAAILVAWLALVSLAKDWQVLVIAGLGLMLAYWIGGGFGADPETGRGAPDFWGALILLVAAVSLCIFWRYERPGACPMKKRGAKYWREVFGIGLAIWFLYEVHNGLDTEWRAPLMAAFASVSIWWAKEFGSDIPGVHEEILRARAVRPNSAPGDFTIAEEDYLCDARMDARTDGLFYIAGAWIGAGVLSDAPSLTDRSWQTGVELIGVLVFLGVFLFEGRRWAFRQAALDQTGAASASRLAVFRAGIKLGLLGEGREGAPPPWRDKPIQALHDFAHGVDDGDERRLDHLLIFGRTGSGRSPLGRALASEAALTNFSSADDKADGQTLGAEDARTARFIQMRNLARRVMDVDPDGRATPTRGGDKARGASLVVLDDVDLSETRLEDAMARLMVEDGQQTVWLCESHARNITDDGLTRDQMDAWTPDWRADAATIRRIENVLRKADPKARIAVGFTARFRVS